MVPQPSPSSAFGDSVRAIHRELAEGLARLAQPGTMTVDGHPFTVHLDEDTAELHIRCTARTGLPAQPVMERMLQFCLLTAGEPIHVSIDPTCCTPAVGMKISAWAVDGAEHDAAAVLADRLIATCRHLTESAEPLHE